jgi:hypothetical protein
MADPKASAVTRLAAANALLVRGFGNPKEATA